MEILEIRDVSVSFGGLRALDEVSFKALKSEIIGIIGPNGSGKTTLFNTVTGFVPAVNGEIIFEGENISKCPPYLIAAKGVCRSYQKTSLFPNLTVEQNITIGRHTTRKDNLWAAIWNTAASRRDQKTNNRQVKNILAFLEMTEHKTSLASSLPYGDQRLLGIGVALASEPRLLLLDEPAAGLNPEETNTLVAKIRKIREKGTTILLVEHDMKMVMGICDRIIVLNYGKKIAEGRPEVITRNEDVIKVYLGEGVNYA